MSDLWVVRRGRLVPIESRRRRLRPADILTLGMVLVAGLAAIAAAIVQVLP